MQSPRCHVDVMLLRVLSTQCDRPGSGSTASSTLYCDAILSARSPFARYAENCVEELIGKENCCCYPHAATEQVEGAGVLKQSAIAGSVCLL